ncbi:hypothetical protein D9H24_24015 [Escherichia coli]|jgi:hypothetical protein|nr:hypothetical protein [Escherichia coli]
MVNGMVYQKGLYDRGNAFPDKVLLLVYPFSVCTMQCLYFPLCALWIKKTVMAAPKHPASASRPRNKLRARSPLSFASLCQTVI